MNVRKPWKSTQTRAKNSLIIFSERQGWWPWQSGWRLLACQPTSLWPPSLDLCSLPMGSSRTWWWRYNSLKVKISLQNLCCFRLNTQMLTIEYSLMGQGMSGKEEVPMTDTPTGHFMLPLYGLTCNQNTMKLLHNKTLEHIQMIKPGTPPCWLTWWFPTFGVPALGNLSLSCLTSLPAISSTVSSGETWMKLFRAILSILAGKLQHLNSKSAI